MKELCFKAPVQEKCEGEIPEGGLSISGADPKGLMFSIKKKPRKIFDYIESLCRGILHVTKPSCLSITPWTELITGLTRAHRGGSLQCTAVHCSALQ